MFLHYRVLVLPPQNEIQLRTRIFSCFSKLNCLFDVFVEESVAKGFIDGDTRLRVLLNGFKISDISQLIFGLIGRFGVILAV